MTDWVFPPPGNARDLYRAVVEPKPAENGWPGTMIRVEKFEERGIQAGQEWERWSEVVTYKRNYSFMGTFEPFFQLRDGEWKPYALISQRYVKFDVLDLSTGRVIATEGISKDNLREAQKSLEALQEKDPVKYANYTAESIAAGWGFCPVDFYVPSYHDEWDEDPEFEKEMYETQTPPSWWGEHDERLRGDWAIYAGCVWGDDSSWKIRYIDLSRITEGIVTSDERFGYVELPSRMKLRDAVRYYEEADRLEIATAIHFNRETGAASKWSMEGIKKEA